ncbi:hypothetical protein HYT17_01600 [Candidatus Microgenomates bacterium]|nr:hypothetical protein [Candidatus Microgenomates bacterium]
MKHGLLNEFYGVTISDPLFAAEGLNIDNAQLALDELEEITKKLQIVKPGLSGRIYFWFNPLTKILHPFRFLRSFLKSEKARRLFLTNPTLPHAKLLLQSYYDTVRSLEKDLSSYRSACLSAQEKTLSKFPRANAYNFYRARVPFADFISYIDLMGRNSQALRQEIEERSRLLLASMQKDILNSSDKRNKKITTPPAKPVINSIPYREKGKKLSSQYREIIKWIEQGRDYSYYLEQRYGPINTELIGPIFYKLSQFDGKSTSHQFFISIAKDQKNTPRSLHAILADQYHFIELAKDKYKFYADIAAYEPLIKRGINYWYQPATSFYFTPDLTYYPDLATIVDLKRRPLLNKPYLLSQKSSLLDLLLWNGYFHNLSYFQSITSRINKKGKKNDSWHYLLIGRSYPSLYYLSFNRSVWRLAEKANFLGAPTKKSPFYITFSQLPSTLKKKDLQNIFAGGQIRAKDDDTTISNFKK